jgi:hypothetical protein
MLAVIFAGAFRLVWNLNSLARHEFEPHPHSIPSAWCNSHGHRNHLHDVAFSLFLSRPFAGHSRARRHLDQHRLTPFSPAIDPGGLPSPAGRAASHSCDTALGEASSALRRIVGHSERGCGCHAPRKSHSGPHGPRSFAAHPDVSWGYRAAAGCNFRKRRFRPIVVPGARVAQSAVYRSSKVA